MAPDELREDVKRLQLYSVQKQLLMLDFTTVSDYLSMLQGVAESLSDRGSIVMVSALAVLQRYNCLTSMSIFTL